MIQSLDTTDLEPVVRLVVAAEMFEPDEAGFLHEMFDEYFTGGIARGHRCLVERADRGPVAVAYFQPRPAGDRLWDLTMIAVHPAHQGAGHGQNLLRAVETELRTRNQRLLLIDTSSTQHYDRARRIYVEAGYTREARVRDYWAEGDDLIVFSKRL